VVSQYRTCIFDLHFLLLHNNPTYELFHFYSSFLFDLQPAPTSTMLASKSFLFAFFALTATAQEQGASLIGSTLSSMPDIPQASSAAASAVSSILAASSAAAAMAPKSTGAAATNGTFNASRSG
jgi:hypothetical protein